MRKSLRLRTAFWNLVFFTVLFFFFGAALYSVTAYSLERQLDQSLVSQASTAAELFLRELRKLKGDPLDAATQTISKVRLRGWLLAIFSERELLAATVPLEHQEVAAITESMGHGATQNSAVLVPGSALHGTRAAGHHIKSDLEQYLVVAVEPLDSIAYELLVVRRVMAYALPPVLLLAGLGSYLPGHPQSQTAQQVD
jgi:hypothetical protein